MLKGISPYLSPELLSILAKMGHGDELVLADAHFPGHSQGPEVVRADGISIGKLLDGIMPLFELDAYQTPLIMMKNEPGDVHDPEIAQRYLSVVARHTRQTVAIEYMKRADFYVRARSAFAIVMTGEMRKYGNLIVKKGVIPVPE